MILKIRVRSDDGCKNPELETVFDMVAMDANTRYIQ